MTKIPTSKNLKYLERQKHKKTVNINIEKAEQSKKERDTARIRRKCVRKTNTRRNKKK